MGKKSFLYMRGIAVVVDGRRLGEVRGKFYYRQVFGSRHFLKKPGGISFLVASLDVAESLGASVAVVVDREDGFTYRASIADIRRLGAVVDRGYGAQLALTFGHWTIDKPMAEVLADVIADTLNAAV